MKSRTRRITRVFLFSFLLGCLAIFFADYLIEKKAEDRTFTNADLIRKNKVGLLLGTSAKLKNGKPNPYFTHRIEAAVELFNRGKIEYILVSGDNGSKYYDEPTDIREALVLKGIPEERIFLDYAGFRTLDSIVRARDIFGQERITIISQQFHNERAIYLAEHYGMDAVGYNARDLYGGYGMSMPAREYLARTKVFVDIMLGVGPKFLGEKITIN